jgi:hypothetical protein
VEKIKHMLEGHVEPGLVRISEKRQHVSDIY